MMGDWLGRENVGGPAGARKCWGTGRGERMMEDRQGREDDVR